MPRYVVALLLVALLATPVLARAAGGAQAMLNAEVWYLQFEVTIKGTGHTETTKEGTSTVANAAYEHVANGITKFDMRTGGLSLSMMSLSSLPPAEMQKASMDMVMITDQCATWMPADPMLMLQPSGTAKTTLSYDSDTHYPESDMLADREVVKTTGHGEARVKYSGQPMFEIDTTKNAYAILFPFVPSEDENSMTYETTVTGWDSGKSETTTDTSTRKLGFPQNLQFVGVNATSVPFKGKFDPASGKVSGNHSFDVTFDAEMMGIKGTMVVKYTLTQTAPAAGK